MKLQPKWLRYFSNLCTGISNTGVPVHDFPVPVFSHMFVQCLQKATSGYYLGFPAIIIPAKCPEMINEKLQMLMEIQLNVVQKIGNDLVIDILRSNAKKTANVELGEVQKLECAKAGQSCRA